MHVKDAIETRRAYRSLDPAAITDDLIWDLAHAASLSASCFNNQPWRYVFVRDPEVLAKISTAMTRGNQWTERASMVIAVFSRSELDCVIKERVYNWFDTGMATALLILRATELGLVAHPIAGFREAEVKPMLGISEDMTLLTLVIVGTHATAPNPVLSEKQLHDEAERPPRLSLERIAFVDRVPDGVPVGEPVPH
ncbi:MAG: nitroreductase family protein [Caldiserica bacterium]|nr:nitroreductase family protein [Caldisericota bacterium]